MRFIPVCTPHEAIVLFAFRTALAKIGTLGWTRNTFQENRQTCEVAEASYNFRLMLRGRTRLRSSVSAVGFSYKRGRTYIQSPVLSTQKNFRIITRLIYHEVQQVLASAAALECKNLDIPFSIRKPRNTVVFYQDDIRISATAEPHGKDVRPGN